MATPSDIAVAKTLAHVTRTFFVPVSGNQPSRKRGHSSADGQQFERELFKALEKALTWNHCSGPDHFDMALDLPGKSGTHYEFDGAFLTHDCLYIVEAKRVSMLTRAHIGVFVQKLFDVFLAPHEHISRVDIKPVMVSAGSNVSPAAWSHTIAWGILLVTPQRMTPYEILAAIQAKPSHSVTGTLAADCDRLATRIWRPFNQLVWQVAPQSTLYQVDSQKIYDLDTSRDVLESWHECSIRASSLVSVPVP